MKKRFVKTAVTTLMACGFALPAGAASFKVGDIDFSLGGSLRYDVGYQMTDLGDQALLNPDANPGDSDFGLTYPEDRQRDFFCQNPGNSRLKIKAVKDDLTAYVEMAVQSGDITTRHAYVSYDITDNLNLLVGQTYTPIATEGAAQRLDADCNLGGAGNLDLGRRPMVKLAYKMDDLALTFALEDNYAKNNPKLVVNDGANYLSRFELNEATPALTLGATYKTDTFMIAPSVYWQKYQYTGNYYDTTGALPLAFSDVDVQTWILALDGSVSIDPVTLSCEAWYGQNPYLRAGIDNRPSASGNRMGQPVVMLPYAGASDALADVEDVKACGVWVQASMDISKMTVNVGAGYQSSDVESGLALSAANMQTEMLYWDDTVATTGAFVNINIPIAGGFSMQPELAFFDYGDDPCKTVKASTTNQLLGLGNTDLGTDIYAGIHFQYDF